MSKFINIGSDYPENILRKQSAQGGILRFWYNYHNITLDNTFVNFYIIINDSIYENIMEELTPFQKGSNYQSVRIGNNYEIDKLEIYCISGSNTIVKIRIYKYDIV